MVYTFELLSETSAPTNDKHRLAILFSFFSSFWYGITRFFTRKCCAKCKYSSYAQKKQEAISALGHWNVRIFPSGTGRGVGLFSIRNLPISSIALVYRSQEMVAVSRAEVDGLLFPPSLKTAVSDLFYSSKSFYWLPTRPQEFLSFAAALNHSSDPNLDLRRGSVRGTFEYVTTKPVREMEELTIDYRKLVHVYGDDASGLAQLKFSDPDRWFQQESLDPWVLFIAFHRNSRRNIERSWTHK